MDIQSFSKDVDFKGRTVNTSVVLETSFSKEICISMKKDHLIKEHKTPFPIVVHLLMGEIDFGIEGEAVRLRAGDIITLTGGVPHDLRALQDSTVRLTLSKHDKVERVEEVVKNT
jgi:quercetin dioxygenase-like cupin family protein